MKSIYVTDIMLASILIAYGVPRRAFDPTTCEISKDDNGNDKKQYKFWFDTSEQKDWEIARSTIDDYTAAKDWKTLNRDIEDTLYWMKGALENRNSLVHEMNHKVAPMRVMQIGNKTIVVGHRASEKTKEILKKLI